MVWVSNNIVMEQCSLSIRHLNLTNKTTQPKPTRALNEILIQSGVPTLITSVYKRLSNDIVKGHFEPNSRFSLAAISDYYGVSVGTIREALSFLVADGLVIAAAQKGFYVAPLLLEDLQDLTRMRVLLDCDQLEQSLLHGSDSWESNLAQAFHSLNLIEERMNSEGSNKYFEEWEGRNKYFHDVLVSGYPVGAYRRRLANTLYRHGERYRRTTAQQKPKAIDRVRAEHKALFEYAMERDIRNAKAVLKKHIEATLENYSASQNASDSKTAP